MSEDEVRIGDAQIPDSALKALCGKWKICRLEVFGSAQRGQLRPESDIDLLVEFDQHEQWSLMDLVRAEEEFSLLLCRRVELVDARTLRRSKNWIRRDAILDSAEVVYAA